MFYMNMNLFFNIFLFFIIIFSVFDDFDFDKITFFSVWQ